MTTLHHHELCVLLRALCVKMELEHRKVRINGEIAENDAEFAEVDLRWH